MPGPELERAIPRSFGTPPAGASYAYWRSEGASWGHEYQERKKRLVLYHIQEMMLVEYVSRYAEAWASPGHPLRVLEFGCGPGRHLRNLCRIPNVEVFGFDQSASMVSGCAAWADPAWVESRVRVGDPTGPLPFDDASFDLVYSAEVLVHVAPADLPGRLKEILRVTRDQVIHIEPAPGTPVDPACHGGCWAHDLVGAYAALGRTCERLEPGYTVHTPHRVVLGRAPVFTWRPELMAMCRAMQAQIDSGFHSLEAALQSSAGAADAAARRAREMALASAESNARLAEAHAVVRSLRGEVAGLGARLERATGELLDARQNSVVERRLADARLREIAGLAKECERLRGLVAAERAAADATRRGLTGELEASMDRCAALEQRLADAARRLGQASAEYEHLASEIVRRGSVKT